MRRTLPPPSAHRSIRWGAVLAATRGCFRRLSGNALRPPSSWIIHAPENLPSGIGISRAGFRARRRPLV